MSVSEEPSGIMKRQNSNRGSKGTFNLQDAEEEAVVLSLEPHKIVASKKKKLVAKLKPIEPKVNPKTNKIAGNFAAEVLAQLDLKDQNNERKLQMR